MTAEEDELRNLRDALEVVTDWQQRTGSPTEFQPPGPASELAHDDQRANPYRVSHAAWAATAAAVDHLACLRDSLFHPAGPAQVEAKIHPHGQFSLVRAALENASRAVWLLEPDQADERLLRRLRLEWSEAGAQGAVSELTGVPGPSRDDRFSALTALLEPTGIDRNKIKSRVDYASIVKAAGSHLDTGSARQVVIWRACSALAHGGLPGAAGYPDREGLAGQAPGIAPAQITGSILLLATGSRIAIQTIKAALRLYGSRAI